MSNQRDGGLVMSRYVVDRRVGCVAVVEGKRDGGLLPCDPGVIAFWMGYPTDQGWAVDPADLAEAEEMALHLNETPINAETGKPVGGWRFKGRTGIEFARLADIAEHAESLRSAYGFTGAPIVVRGSIEVAL